MLAQWQNLGKTLRAIRVPRTAGAVGAISQIDLLLTFAEAPAADRWGRGEGVAVNVLTC